MGAKKIDGIKDQEFLKPAQCAAEIGVAPRTINHWIKIKKLQGYTTGTRNRIEKSTWLEFKSRYLKKIE